MKKPLAIVISLLVLGAPAGKALAGNTLDEVKRKGVLVAGVKSASPPFGFQCRGSGELAGYDVEFVKAIAARLGVKAVVTPVTAANRISELLEGNIDIIAAAMAKTPDREKVVDFSDTYYLTSQKVLAKKGTVKGLADLAGKKIGTAGGSTWEFNVKSKVPGAATVAFDNSSRAAAALRNGEIDAVSTDEVILVRLLSKLPQGEYEIPPIRISEEPYGLAVRKGDKALLRAVNATMRAMVKDGDARRIFEKCFVRTTASLPEDAASGIVVRKSADLTRFVVMPIKGIFKPGADVSFFDPAGDFVAKGTVKSYYTDEVYVDAEPGKADEMDYGFVVGMNVSDAEAKAVIRKNQDLLKSITEQIREENLARREEIGREGTAMEKQRRQEQLAFERLKMQLDYAYDNYYYGWYGYPW